MKRNKIKSRIARSVGLAGLAALLNFSQESRADSGFSFSASLGGYSPFGDVVALEGIPYGVELEGDYSLKNENIGVRGGAGWFTKGGYQRREFRTGWSDYRRREVLEGESESSEIARFYAGLRAGKPWAYVGFGGVAVEGKNTFETADRGFFRREVSEFVDRKSLHGIYGEFCAGGPIKKDGKTDNRISLFLKGTYDKFFDKENSGGIKFNVGVTVSN